MSTGNSRLSLGGAPERALFNEPLHHMILRLSRFADLRTSEDLRGTFERKAGVEGHDVLAAREDEQGV